MTIREHLGLRNRFISAITMMRNIITLTPHPKICRIGHTRLPNLLKIQERRKERVKKREKKEKGKGKDKDRQVVDQKDVE